MSRKKVPVKKNVLLKINIHVENVQLLKIQFISRTQIKFVVKTFFNCANKN